MNQQDLDALLKPKGFRKGSLKPYTALAQDKELIGKEETINTVITRNEVTNRILVYGQHIEDGTIFAGLNLSIGMRIGYREPEQLRFYDSVKFEDGEIFGLPNEYVGLVNIVSEDLEIDRYDPSDF